MARTWLSITVELVSGRDDGESPVPADTGDRDLPPLLHEWQ